MSAANSSNSTASAATRDAPRSVTGILRQLGPGLIIAGSVVGSGELIATTIAGAEAGFYLLWLILLGCVIKVFVQLEIGKYTVASGRTALESLAELPGWKWRGMHWIGWAARLMFFTGIGQRGGGLGGVGQAFSIAAPLTAEARDFNAAAEKRTQDQLRALGSGAPGAEARPVAPVASVPLAPTSPAPSNAHDVLLWSLGIAVLTAAALYWGRYAFIEWVSLILVGGFTFVSFANLWLLQRHGRWAVRGEDILQGLSLRLPPFVEGVYPVATALAAFGIIGMAAGELIFYPYWCLEKGYARHVGPNDGSREWVERARGWIRVMRWDAWGSVVVYTVSTVAFYLLGAAVLGRAGLRPQGMDLVHTLAAMYAPAFGEWAVGMFLVGAIAVLYSTFFVNNASSALIWTDAIRLLRLGAATTEARGRLRRILAVALPMLGFVMFWIFPNPRVLVLLAGMTQTLMLPLVGVAALHYRFRRAQNPLGRSRSGDVFLCLCVLALAIAGAWLLFTLLFPELRHFA